MDSQQTTPTQTTPTQTTQPIPQEPKKCKHLPIIIVLIILLVASCAFGGFELWQNIQKESEITKLKEDNNPQDAPTENNTPDAPTNNKTISINEAEQLLEKYIGEGNETWAHGLSAYYNTFIKEFDEQQKAFIAYDSIDESDKSDVSCIKEWHEKGSCTGKSISYDTMSKKFQSLFGNYGSIEKKNYTFQDFFYLVYDESIGGYREYILPGGGTTPIKALHKVVSVDKDSDSDDMIVSLVYAELNADVEVPSGICGPTYLSGGLGVKDETLKETTDSMALYKFTLSPYNGSYVLTNVAKQ